MTTDSPEGAIDGRADFEAAVARAFAHAAARGARRIVAVDPHFAAWPWDDPALLAMLTGWLKAPQRKLVLLAHDYAAMPRLHPRFVAWRMHWAHAVEPWAPPEVDRVELPTLLVDDDALVLELIDPVHLRGRCTLDAQEAHRQRERVDALLQRCEPAFAVRTLGL